MTADTSRARLREQARNAAASARTLSRECMDSDHCPIGVLRALIALAEAVEHLADASESAEGL